MKLIKYKYHMYFHLLNSIKENGSPANTWCFRGERRIRNFKDCHPKTNGQGICGSILLRNLIARCSRLYECGSSDRNNHGLPLLLENFGIAVDALIGSVATTLSSSCFALKEYPWFGKTIKRGTLLFLKGISSDFPVKLVLAHAVLEDQGNYFITFKNIDHQMSKEIEIPFTLCCTFLKVSLKSAKSSEDIHILPLEFIRSIPDFFNFIPGHFMLIKDNF